MATGVLLERASLLKWGLESQSVQQQGSELVRALALVREKELESARVTGWARERDSGKALATSGSELEWVLGLDLVPVRVML